MTDQQRVYHVCEQLILIAHSWLLIMKKTCFKNMLQLKPLSMACITFIFITHGSHAKVNYELANDSVRELLILAKGSLETNSALSLQYAQQALKRSKEKNDISSRIYSLLSLGNIYEKQKKMQQAENYYLQAIAYEQEWQELTPDHNMLFYLADGAEATGQYQLAIDYLDRGINSQKETSNSGYLMHAYDLRSRAYSLKKEYYKSIESSERSLEIAKKQHSTDFILRSYRKIAQSYKKLSNYRSSIKYNRLAIEIVEKKGDEKTVAQYLEYLATDQRSLGMYAEALKNAHKALYVQRKFKDEYRISNLLLNLSIIYLKLSSYDNALLYAQEMLELHEGTNNLNKIASASNQLGLVYNRLKRYDEAEQYYQRTLSLDKTAIEPRYRASAFRTLAEINFNSGQMNTAMGYAKQGLNLSREINDLRGEAAGNYSIAQILRQSNRSIEAVEYFEQSLNISIQIGDIWSEARSHIYLGITCINDNREKAEETIQKGLKQAIELDAISLQVIAYESLKDIEKINGNFKLALQYAEKYLQLIKKTNNQAIEDRIIEWKTTKETEKKAKEIEKLKSDMQIRDLQLTQKETELTLLNNENTISALKIREQRSRIIIAFTLAIIFALVLTFLYMRYRYLQNVQKTLNRFNEEIQSKNTSLEDLNHTKDRFFSIISHDLRTPVGSIIALSDMLKDNFDRFKQDEIKQTIFDIQKAAERTYLLLENLLSWAIIQLRNADPVPRRHELKSVCESAILYLESPAKTKNISINLSIDDQEHFYADKNMINTVIRNLLANAIKYTEQNGEISIYSKTDDETVTVHVLDSGIGIKEIDKETLFNIDRLVSNKGTEGETGAGFGLALSKDLLQKNGGEIRVKSLEAKGSDFYFTLPVKEPKDQ